MKRLLWLLRWCPRNCCPVWCWNMLKPSLDMGDKEKHTQCCTPLPYHLYKSCQMRVDQGFVPPRAPIWTHFFPNALQVPVALFSTKLIKPRCNSLHFPTIMIWLLLFFPAWSYTIKAYWKHVGGLHEVFKSCFYSLHWNATSSDTDSNFKVE